MSEWKEYKLGEVALKMTSGGTPKTSESAYYNGGIPWLNTKEVNFNRISKTEKNISELGLSNSSAKWIPKYSVIVAMYGATAGKVAYSLINLTTNQACCNVTVDKKKADSLFMYYYLQSSYVELENLACGAAQQNLSVGVISNFPVLLPPLAQQEFIAGVLSSLDDKIDLLNCQNQTLESMAEALFRHYFIDNAQPEWKDGVISDLIDFNPARKLTKNTVAPFLEMSELSTRTYAPNGWYERVFTSGTKFQNGDTLLARITPCLENGKTAYVDFLKEDQVGWGSTEYIVMRPKEIIHPFFAYVIAKYKDFRDFAESCMSGSSGRQRVDVENLKSYECKIPDRESINKFNTYTKLAVEKMNYNNTQICTLTKLRDTLLPKLMNGRD